MDPKNVLRLWKVQLSTLLKVLTNSDIVGERLILASRWQDINFGLMKIGFKKIISSCKWRIYLPSRFHHGKEPCNFHSLRFHWLECRSLACTFQLQYTFFSLPNFCLQALGRFAMFHHSVHAFLKLHRASRGVHILFVNLLEVRN